MARIEIVVALSEFAVSCKGCPRERYRVGKSVNCDGCMQRSIENGFGQGANGNLSDTNPHITPQRLSVQ